jgi:type II secretory pathway pseudopilin PulG
MDGGISMRNRAAERGMTLIEILIALIVMVLGVLGILALFPPALQSGTESMEATNAAILAESVAHALVQGFQSAEEDKASTTLKLKVTMSHDLQAGTAMGRYTFVLPPLPTNPTTNPDWWHYPSTASPPGQGGSGAPGDTGSKMVGGTWDPEADDRHFQLGGDQFIVNTVKSVHDMNDPTDPLTQFGFSFDIRKIDDMWYQRRNPGAIDPYRNAALKAEEYEAMSKLYEVRIHILRMSSQLSSGTTTGGGQAYRRYITTFTKRISVR